METLQRAAARMPGVVMAGAACLFGVILAIVTWQLRSRLHEQVLRREVEALQAVAYLQLGLAGPGLTDLGVDDPGDDIFGALLESARLRGVLFVQLHAPSGELVASLPRMLALAPPWWDPAAQQVLGRFHRRVDVGAWLGVDEPRPAQPSPVLEAAVPLGEAGFPGWVARYWVDGHPVARELRALDLALARQAGGAWLTGTSLLLGLLWWGFRRLRAVQHRLERQAEELKRANQELIFAAKTSAIGALSAHLLHGLKNPIIGLEALARDQAAEQAGSEEGEAWRAAVASARRLRQLVTEVLEVLQEDAGDPAADPLPLADVLQRLVAEQAATGRRAHVELVLAPVPADLLVSPRTAALFRLILTNLLENALTASPTGAQVELRVQVAGPTLSVLVQDQAGGLPEAVRRRLFQPVPSTTGGSGLGLAISQRLARHAGGELTCRAHQYGTVFELSLPRYNPAALPSV